MSSVPHTGEPDVTNETTGVSADVLPAAPSAGTTLTPEMLAAIQRIVAEYRIQEEAIRIVQTPTELTRYIPRPATVPMPTQEPNTPLAIVTGMGHARVRTLDFQVNEWRDVLNADELEAAAVFVIQSARGDLSRWGHYALPPWLAAQVKLWWEPFMTPLSPDEIPAQQVA